MTDAPLTPTLDRMLDETRQLLETARGMVACMDPTLEILPVDQRLLVVREASRLTGRLTAVLSWLLAQKAVANGEYAATDSRAAQALFGTGDDRIDPTAGGDVPEWAVPFSDLLRESALLYRRAARLDRSIRSKGGARHGRSSRPS